MLPPRWRQVLDCTSLCAVNPESWPVIVLFWLAAGRRAGDHLRVLDAAAVRRGVRRRRLSARCVLRAQRGSALFRVGRPPGGLWQGRGAPGRGRGQLRRGAGQGPGRDHRGRQPRHGGRRDDRPGAAGGVPRRRRDHWVRPWSFSAGAQLLALHAESEQQPLSCSRGACCFIAISALSSAFISVGCKICCSAE